MKLSRQVAEALAAGSPLVALESTIITHGMPYPDNLNTASAVEATILKSGAVPATIAVLNGRIHVGMEPDQLEKLAQDRDVLKLSRADLAYAVSQARSGSTTVAATMMIAAMAGLDVFATGGIGGVHRGGEYSLDVSADLQEFSRTGTIVVCAGAKAILDIDRTLEVLETNGVPVITYQSDTFPAFWSRDSGIASPLRMDQAGQIADHFRVRRELGIQGGMLIANPVAPEHEIPAGQISSVITKALQDADDQGISGKQTTPYLLSRMLDLTSGKSLETNVQLVLNNARLAAAIAIELAARRR